MPKCFGTEYYHLVYQLQMW